jgi:hypothetical protein
MFGGESYIGSNNRCWGLYRGIENINYVWGDTKIDKKYLGVFILIVL